MIICAIKTGHCERTIASHIKSQDYSRYTAYNLETKMININQTYNETTNDHTMQIYDVNVKNEVCGEFACKATHARPNRRPLLPYQSTCSNYESTWS